MMSSITLSNPVHSLATKSKQVYRRINLENTPDILLVSDIDHSILPWKDGKYKVEVDEDTLTNNYRAILDSQNRIFTVLVTGLDLPSVQQMRRHFNNSPIVDGLSTDNGKGGLFTNNDGIETTKWLDGIGIKNQSIEWEAFVKEQAGWDQDLFLKAVFKELLLNRKLKEVKDSNIKMAYPHYSVYQSQDDTSLDSLPITLISGPYESAIYLMKNSNVSDEKTKELGIQIAKDICSNYSKDGNSKIKFKMSEHDDYYYLFFSPDNGIEIDKALAMDFIVRQLPDEILENMKAGIAIGDSENDTHLKIESIELPSKKILPFHAIFSGTDLLGNEDFSKHPRKEISYLRGNVGRSIRNVIAKIDTNS